VDEARIRLAENLLREGVFRSRDRQSALHTLKGGVGSCGLGEKAEVVLDLSPRGRELFGSLFARGLDEPATERFRATMSGWIEEQDSLDRKRNHFLKAFRGKNGIDRTTYSPDVLADYEAGLAKIGDEEDRARRLRAEALADL
jgi:hypothetical protein